jgi:5-methylcytosine-specific restriction protein A
VTAGAFSPGTRAAIYQVNDGRCIGCGRTDLTAQHRRARGMGGSRDPLISKAPNGVPLCGSGNTGCHGWTEDHPTPAELLGWRLVGMQDALEEPFWTRFGWRRWLATRMTPDSDDFYTVGFVDIDDLDRYPLRIDAIAEYTSRKDCWR